MDSHHNIFSSFKASKHKPRFYPRSQSTVPYIHFSEESHSTDNHKHIKKTKKKRIKSNTNSIDDDDISYHSDPSCHSSTDLQIKKSRKLRKYHTHTNLKKLHMQRHNLEHEKDEINKKHRKILLLGNGSCGKTTIFRQFQLILGDHSGFDDNELSEAIHAIRQNCVSMLLIVLHKAIDLYQQNSVYFADCAVDDNNDAITESINFVMKFRSESFEKCENFDLTELACAISFLWNLKCVQSTIKFRHKRFAIPDNISYFYEQIDTIMNEDYMPSIDDVIRLRVRTTGMIEHSYAMLAENNFDEYKLSIFDTGGERNERKKWVHTFEVCLKI